MKTLDELTKEFEYIKTLRSDIIEIFNEIQFNLDSLNKIYIEVVKKYHNKDILFGLDSFYFQNKIIEMEYEGIHKIFISIDNRTYCEYYKLYKIIQDYIINDVKDSKIIEKLSKKTYPIYKDLEPLKVYDFDIICDINSSIIKNIQLLAEYLAIKKTEMKDNTEYSDMGLNIHNIINIQDFSNALINERIKMFTKYLDTINSQISKYISRLILKSKLMIGVVNQDIHLKQINNINTNTVADINRIKLNRKMSTIDSIEAENMRNYINYENTDIFLQNEFNSIISAIPVTPIENKNDIIVSLETIEESNKNSDNKNSDNKNSDNNNTNISTNNE